MKNTIVEREEIRNYPKEIADKARRYFDAHPKRKAVLVLDSEGMYEFLFDAANGAEIQ